MTKEEFTNKFRNSKVYVDGKSEEIQKVLFEAGFKWASGDREIRHTEYPFLFIEEGEIVFGSDMNCFVTESLPEVRTSDILKGFTRGYKFEPFQKVLVRDGRDRVWKADIYSHHCENNPPFPHQCVGNYWKYVIPYEGNEHLLGKKDSL